MPLREMQKLMVWKGDMFSCGWLPPAAPIAPADITASDVLLYAPWLGVPQTLVDGLLFVV
jgi:hypothetical protein